MRKDICTNPECRNFGMYCRIHLVAHEKVVKPIPKVSDKRKDENKEYKKAITQFMRENPICQFPGCNQPSEDPHHSEGRVGKNLLDVTKLKALCRDHHSWVELHPKQAKEMGLSASRLKK